MRRPFSGRLTFRTTVGWGKSEIVKCSTCGFENDADAKFCENCGAALARSCSNCGSPLKPDAKFCKRCGAPVFPATESSGRDVSPTRLYAPPTPAPLDRLDLGVGAPADSTSDIRQRLAALERGAPDALREKMRAASIQIEGERKPVTILFTDIVGSTTYAERLDPEVWREIVSGAHRLVSDAVYRYEGTIAQLLGDGVLAFFGAPITHEDDPLRAVRAGLDIQRAMEEYARGLIAYVPHLQLRVGIHTGVVVVGSVDSDLHMEYLAIGDAVNLAARLQSAAQPGQVLVSEATARLVRSGVELESLGEITVKGKAEPVQVYRALGLRVAFESGRGIEGMSSPLVGRDGEMAAMRAALEELAQGRGQIVSIIGEAGIGKSRLVEEVRRDYASGATWLEGRSLSYGQSLSNWAIAELVKHDLGLADDDPELKMRLALRRRAGELFGARQADKLPYLAHLLGVSLDDASAERVRALDGETLKRQLHSVLCEYFERAAQHQPVVLVFEDFHWADPSTLETVRQLFAVTERAPLMILMLFRVERDHGSWQLKVRAETDFAHRYTELMLTPLSAPDSQQLINNLLDLPELPAALRDLILERSEGNPLYMEEVIRSLIDQGALAYADGHWHVVGEIANVTIPETLHGVLLARIDRLAEDVRRTLQIASVLGKSFLYRLLQAIAEAERELDEHLVQLQRADLVREKTRRPELEYIFKHSLTQQAAYDSLLVERRREFHRKAGEALEELFGERRAEYYALLAHHFDCAAVRDKAADYLIKAGDRARLGDNNQEAYALYKRAIELLTEQGDDARAAHTWLKLGLLYTEDYDFDAAFVANENAFALERRARSTSLAATRRGDPAWSPSRGATLRLDWSVPQRLDPGSIGWLHEGCAVENLFAGLIKIDHELNVVPHAARSWQVLDDGTRYVFYLRDDLRWSDGTPVTAMDFQWALERNKTLTKNEGVGRELAPVAAVGAPDPLILEVRLAAPSNTFLYTAAAPITYPLPRAVVERNDDAWTRPEHLISNGPFILREWQPGERLVLERNPFYFGELTGNVARVEWTYEPDAARRLQRYLRDEIDVCMLVKRTQLPPDLPVEQVRARSALRTLKLNLLPDRPPLDDVRVRRALALTLDRQAIMRQWSGGEPILPLGGILPPGMPGHSPEVGLHQDIQQARELFAQAGWHDGSHMALTAEALPQFWAILEEIAAQWKEYLRVEVSLKEYAAYSTRAREELPHIVLLAWIPDNPDPANVLRNWSGRALTASQGWDYERWEEILERAARTRNRAERLALYREADRILVAEAVVAIPIAYGFPGHPILVKPRVRGDFLSPLFHLDFGSVTLDVL